MPHKNLKKYGKKHTEDNYSKTEQQTRQKNAILNF
jgi:hypothetical protein